MKKDTHIILGICLIFLCAAAFLFYKDQKKTVLSENMIAPSESVETFCTEETSKAPEPEPECAVSVLGAVKHPGIFRYQGTARIYDAVEASGGFKKNAAEESVNLAKPLTDGEQILVLTKKQMKKQKNENNSHHVADSGQKLLNINQAGKEDFMTLPGIGETKAMLIINYRTEHGNFSKPEDLMNIPGIKEGIFNKIRSLVTAG